MFIYFSNQVARAEGLFAAFIVKHNNPIAVADHAAQLFRSMLPDSKIAEKFSSARTKIRQTLGAIAANVRQETIAAVQQRPFSLSTNGWNDMGSEQLYPVLLRYHNDVKVVTEVLTISTPGGASTGEGIFYALNQALISAGLNLGQLPQL